MTNGNIILCILPPYSKPRTTYYVCFSCLELCNLFGSNTFHIFIILAFWPFGVRVQTITTMIIVVIITFLFDNKNHKKRVNTILFFYTHVLIATLVN